MMMEQKARTLNLIKALGVIIILLGIIQTLNVYETGMRYCTHRYYLRYAFNVTHLILNAVVSVFLLVSGAGMLKLKNWSRKLIIIASFIEIILCLTFRPIVLVWYPLGTNTQKLIIGHYTIFWIFIYSSFIWIFNQDDVKSIFKTYKKNDSPSVGILLFGYWLIMLGLAIALKVLFYFKYLLQGRFGIITFFTMIIASFLCFFLGRGILKLKRWARILILISPALYYLLFRNSLFYKKLIPFTSPVQVDPKFYILLCIGMMICVFIIYFFTRPKVKEQFISYKS